MASYGTAQATIANAASLSGAVPIVGEVVAIDLPTLTTDSSSITFQGSFDGDTFRELQEVDGTAYTVTTAATGATLALLSSAATNPPIRVPWLKVRTGTSGAAVNQGSARTITLIIKKD